MPALDDSGKTPSKRRSHQDAWSEDVVPLEVDGVSPDYIQYGTDFVCSLLWIRELLENRGEMYTF